MPPITAAALANHLIGSLHQSKAKGIEKNVDLGGVPMEVEGVVVFPPVRWETFVDEACPVGARGISSAEWGILLYIFRVADLSIVQLLNVCIKATPEELAGYVQSVELTFGLPAVVGVLKVQLSESLAPQQQADYAADIQQVLGLPVIHSTFSLSRSQRP